MAKFSRMKRSSAALICLILVCTLFLVPSASADWPMFGSDPQHSGVGTGSPPLTPTLLWNFTAPIQSYPNVTASFQSSPAVVNGVVYIGCSNGDVYLLNAKTGTQLWSNGVPGNISPAVADGIVVTGSGDGGVAGFDAASGKLLWSFDTGDWGISSPIIANGVVYMASTGTEAYAVNLKKGYEIWSIDVGPTYSSPAFSNGVVYLGSGSGVFAFNATNGDTLWRFITLSYVSSSPSVVNGVVYIPSGDGNLYALNASSGQKIWNYNFGPVGSASSPAVVNGIVYVLLHHEVYAFNGNKLWNSTVNPNPPDLPMGIYSSPSVANGVVCVGVGNRMYALNATNGFILWSYQTEGIIESSPAVVNGIIYFGSTDGTVYALGSVSSTSPLTPIRIIQISLVVFVVVIVAAAIVIIRWNRKAIKAN